VSCGSSCVPLRCAAGPGSGWPACCVVACRREHSPPPAVGNRFLVQGTLLCWFAVLQQWSKANGHSIELPAPRTLAFAGDTPSAAAKASVRDGRGNAIWARKVAV